MLMRCVNMESPLLERDIYKGAALAVVENL
jgi:hypothetical protein